MRWLAHRGGALDFRDFARANPGAAVSDGRGAGGRPGHHPGRRDAGAGQPLRVPVCRPAARQRAPRWSPARGRGRARSCRCRPAPRSCSRATSRQPPGFVGEVGTRRAAEGARRLPARAGRPVRRPHRLLQRAGLVPGVPLSTASRTAAADLPLHLHRQAARRAGGAGRGAERGVRAHPAEAVSRDRRLLPAARGLQLPHGRGHLASRRPTRATPSA